MSNLSKVALSKIIGGYKWKSLSEGNPKICPCCGSQYIANYEGNKWICAECGKVIE